MRARLPELFDARRVLFEDADLLVVDKPAGLPCQSPDPAYPDDLVHLLEAWLARRDGAEVRLGVHQRLDRDTSGVIVYAKSPRANASLATQFEQRTVTKEYVAGVTSGQRAPRAHARLEHALTERERGRVTVVPQTDPRGRQAVLEYTMLERRRERALLGVRLETGRTHQIRVQLAHVGLPIAGDLDYGGIAQRRMMLHASALGLLHPATGASMRFVAKVPTAFRRFLAGEDALPHDRYDALEGYFRDAWVRRAPLVAAGADARAIDAFRIFHGEAEGAPSVALDVYAGFGVLHVHDDLPAEAEQQAVDAAARLGLLGVYLKRRPARASDLVTTRTAEVAPTMPVAGVPHPSPFVVREHGVRYLVELGDGLSTGIFLDQRDNRRRVMEAAPGARVLNLFAYTGAFSIAALVAGAREAVTVDAARPALAWAERNAALNDVSTRHRAVRGDVFAVLDALVAEGASFDLVVCDPPTFSTTKTSRFRSGSDWVALAEACGRVLGPGGALLCCSNDRRLRPAAFAAKVREGTARAGLECTLRDHAPPLDFPRVSADDSPLKSVWLTRR